MEHFSLALLSTLLFLLSGAKAPAAPGADDLCTWWTREEVPNGDFGPADCLSKCRNQEMCVNHPREYLCTGRLMTTDTDDNRHDPSSIKR